MNNTDRRDAEMLYMFDRDTAAQMKQARELLNRLNKADYTDYSRNIFVGKNFFAR